MTTVITDTRNPTLRAVFLRSHLRLLAVGMTHSRIKKGDILKWAGELTEKKYKRGEYKLAAEDLTKYIEENK